jgi:hypothetical protein
VQVEHAAIGVVGAPRRQVRAARARVAARADFAA